MHHFDYRGGRLHCEDVALDDIADAVGTPVYVYSTATLTRHHGVLADAFKDMSCLIAYSVKANGNLGVVATLAQLGAGADVVSGGELKKAMRAGVPASKIVFSGVAKSKDDIRHALDVGIHQFNVESVPELHRISAIAEDMNVSAPIAFRVNPHVAAGGHANISTGKAEDKFGVAWHEAEALYARAAALLNIEIVGVDVHIGSQITDIAPMREAFEKVVGLVKSLRAAGHNIARIDLGGGLGIPYSDGENPDTPADYADMIRDVLGELDVEVILEPGRMIAGNAGVMVSEVEYVKERDGRTFVILDAGMNDLMRPALYSAHHDIRPLAQNGSDRAPVDVVGPICESTDRFAKARDLPDLPEGARVAFMSAGAYGAVMSSQYNVRPLTPEVLVSGDKFEIVRKRPSFEDMIALERTPDWLDTP
ncbi:MAG: diaminopimelate decarboxylase [Pseudomonadota bacterium]